MKKVFTNGSQYTMTKILRQTVFFQATGYLFQIGAFFIFAKVLGGAGQGVLTIFRTIGQIIASFMWIGLFEGAHYFVAKENQFFLSAIKNCLKWLILAFSLIILIICIIPINNIPKLNLVEQYIPRLLIFVLFLSFFNLFQLLILSLKKYFYYNLFAFCSGFAIFTFSLFVNLIPQNLNKLDFAITAYIISYGITFIYGVILIFFEGNKLKAGKKKVLSFYNQVKVGIKSFISRIAGLLLFRLDLFLIGFFLSIKEVGIYSVALFSAEMITQIPRWCASIITPMVASNEKEHVKRTVYLFYSAIIVSILFGAVILLLIKSFPNFISNLVGKDFVGVELCLLLLLPRVIMQSGVSVLAANLAGKGYPWYHPGGNIAGLIFVVSLDLFLIPRYGIIGAAVANSAGYISCSILYFIGFYVKNMVGKDSMKSYFVNYLRDIKSYIWS